MAQPDQGDYSRLTYEEVKRFIGFLPTNTLEELAEGPLPDEPRGVRQGDNCRACAALEPLQSSGPASVLLEWHDFVSKSFKLLGEIIHGEHEEEIEQALIDDMQGLVGACSYARCCAIYGLAAAELNHRRLVACEDPEPVDDRDEEERRRDGEAEDAERRLDAEKAGDL